MEPLQIEALFAVSKVRIRVVRSLLSATGVNSQVVCLGGSLRADNGDALASFQSGIREVGMTTRLINIVGGWLVKAGPPREELFDALRLFNEYRRVEFTMESTERDPWGNFQRHTLQAQILGIEAEDGSGHSWTLRVSFFEVENQLAFVHRGPYKLYYHDKDRRGVVLSDLRQTQSVA